jgi:hypothetical protein
MEVIVELVGLIDVFRIDLISLLRDRYNRVIDFLGRLMKTSYF